MKAINKSLFAFQNQVCLCFVFLFLIQPGLMA